MTGDTAVLLQRHDSHQRTMCMHHARGHMVVTNSIFETSVQRRGHIIMTLEYMCMFHLFYKVAMPELVCVKGRSRTHCPFTLAW